MRAELSVLLREGARGDILPWVAEEAAARELGIPAREVEAAALEAGLRPERYARNFRTIDLAGQRALHASRVAVVGCGGLGGYLVEELARLGVGCLIAVDPDVFEPSNLNRQILATLPTLGRAKVEAAVERVAAINPAVEVLARRVRLDATNADALIRGAQVVADALDSIPSRLELAGAASRLGIPLVHAAIAGWYLQVTTVPAASSALAELYAGAAGPRGIETELGNPSFTPALAASLEVAEIAKILLGKAPALAGSLLLFDLERMEAVRLPIG